MNIRFVKNDAGANLQQLMEYAVRLTLEPNSGVRIINEKVVTSI